MSIYEIRDPLEARRHVLQSLWLARRVELNDQTVGATLQWAMEIASQHHPLPLVGFVADVAHLALDSLHGTTDRFRQEFADLDATLVRKYEDYVLGKLYADASFQRGADALLRCQGRDRDRGTAFLIQQFVERSGMGGAILVPTVLKEIQRDAEQSTQDVLAEGWRSIDQDGFSPRIREDFATLIDAVRNAGEALGAEDIFELEHGTALAQFGQRLALRQVVQAADQLQRSLPREKLRPRVRHRQVATHIVDEDLYPVGGYTSISTKGSVESLLHSQLAYMERKNRPDLFDIKFLRDELYYYSRDDNQFLRRRKSFVFAIYPDMIHARFKDTQLPWQRIILVLAVLVAAVEKLLQWLSDDALTFEFVFVQSAVATSLQDEQSLLEMLLREQIANSTATITTLPGMELARLCNERSRRSLCHCLTISSQPRSLSSECADVGQMLVDGPQPQLTFDREPTVLPEQEGIEGWAESLRVLLEHWI